MSTPEERAERLVTALARFTTHEDRVRVATSVIRGVVAEERARCVAVVEQAELVWETMNMPAWDATKAAIVAAIRGEAT